MNSFYFIVQCNRFAHVLLVIFDAYEKAYLAFSCHLLDTSRAFSGFFVGAWNFGRHDHNFISTAQKGETLVPLPWIKYDIRTRICLQRPFFHIGHIISLVNQGRQLEKP